MHSRRTTSSPGKTPGRIVQSVLAVVAEESGGVADLAQAAATNANLTRNYRKATRRLERPRLESDEGARRLRCPHDAEPPGEAPTGLGTTSNAIFSSTWTALGTPAVTLPLFKGPSGLPVGLQLVAGRFRDRRLFDVAEAVMKALG
jgi:hypothetical protein